MLGIKTVLVVLSPAHEPERVWAQAQAWARHLQLRLEVMLPVQAEAASAEAAVQQGRQWLQAWLRDAPAGTGQTVVLAPSWGDTVAHEARRLQADWLMLAGCAPDAGLAPELKVLLRQLPCPLYLVQRQQLPQRVAAAMGAGAEDTPHRLLNQTVLEYLQALVASVQGEARVLSALPNPVELVPLMGDVYASSYVGVDLEASYRENLQQQIAAFGLAANALQLSPGRPDLVLPELVTREKIDCLLLGTVARKGLAAFWLGNTAEDVLPRVDCDVLLLRPQDYMTPD